MWEVGGAPNTKEEWRKIKEEQSRLNERRRKNADVLCGVGIPNIWIIITETNFCQWGSGNERLFNAKDRWRLNKYCVMPKLGVHMLHNASTFGGSPLENSNAHLNPLLRIRMLIQRGLWQSLLNYSPSIYRWECVKSKRLYTYIDLPIHIIYLIILSFPSGERWRKLISSYETRASGIDSNKVRNFS